MTISVEIPVDLLVQHATRTLPSEAELLLVERLESGRAALPVLPSVATHALEIANDPNADVQTFSKLIETDPPIAARFLSVANSALYSRGRKVTSVSEAVMRIGLYSCKDLIYQAVYGATLRGLRHYQSEVQASFRRSVLSAVVCRAVCSELGSFFREAYLCGLLHDIGESRIYRILSELELSIEGDQVRDLVARYHARAGAELALKWKLPQEIIEVCSKHHELDTGSSEALRIVRIADWAVPHVQSLLAGSEPTELALDFGSLSGLDVAEKTVRAILDAGFLAAQKVDLAE
jgi:putative nucleotidyltransferase with HDIG domain